MRIALIAAVIAVAFVPQLPGAAQAPATQQGAKVQITFEPGGLVSLTATGATLREVLAEWTRQGGSTFVGSERLAGAPLTLRYSNQPEKDVMASLLRQAAGFMLAPRRAGTIGVSTIEAVYILSTSNPSAGGYSPPPQPQFQQQIINPGAPDDELPPVGRGAPPPSPTPAPPPGPQPAPEYRPAAPAGGGVAVPVIALPPVTTTPPPPPGRGGAAGS